MRLTEYEKKVQREIEGWQRNESSLIQQALNWSMKPMDWLMDQVMPAEGMEQADEVVNRFLALLSDASEWTHDDKDVIQKAAGFNLQVERLEELRDKPLDRLDELARSLFAQNTVLAVLSGGGAGLGGLFLMAADIPVLFAINLRLIQQIGSAYGFPMRGPEFRPLVLAIYNVAAANSRDAKYEAMREMSVAAAAFAHDLDYRGRRVTGSFSDQSRHIAREVVKNVLGRKLAQAIPIAGAAIGAGVNYWFTMQTAEAAHMLFRGLYLERKERL